MAQRHRKRPAQPSRKSAGTGRIQPLALHLAEQMGLTDGPKSLHVNAKVPPQLFAAAARRIGSTSPAVVITAALAALATEDELGPWLARQWGTLSDVAPELLAQIDLSRVCGWPSLPAGQSNHPPSCPCLDPRCPMGRPCSTPTCSFMR